MTSPLEVAFLLANLRAVGLMPDSDFQRIKPGLIELIRKSVYRESQVGEAEISIAQFLDENAGETDTPSFDEWSSGINDMELWKHVISIYLKLAKDIEWGTSLAKFFLPDNAPEFNVVVSPIPFEELSNLFDGQGLPATPPTHKRPGIFDSLSGLSYELNRASRAAIDDLNIKVEALELEIADLRKRDMRSDYRDVNATTHDHSRNAENERAKKSKIAELQRDLQRELRSAELHASKGETFSAGSARGRAARIESMLRALGA